MYSGTDSRHMSHGMRKYLGSTSGAVTRDKDVATSQTSVKLTHTVSWPYRIRSVGEGWSEGEGEGEGEDDEDDVDVDGPPSAPSTRDAHRK